MASTGHTSGDCAEPSPDGYVLLLVGQRQLYENRAPKGKSDPGFRTKLQIAAELARTAKAAGVAFRAVAADCAFGDQDGFRRQLDSAGLPFVMALKPSHGTWAYGKDAYTPVDAARTLT
ncbi:transposase, partial [Streptomyces sp. NPDC048473]|uniref:transposase n=1 Tax=Streptomyces sp. NPDC048473 TaxID=3365556 RepID=UPI0037147ECE